VRAVIRHPYHAAFLFMASARPLKIEFERTVLQEADEDIHVRSVEPLSAPLNIFPQGYCLVQRGRAPLAPLKYAKWKRMYYVLGGQIASHNVLQLYKNRQVSARLLFQLV
jgi:hypothetical protein